MYVCVFLFKNEDFSYGYGCRNLIKMNFNSKSKYLNKKIIFKHPKTKKKEKIKKIQFKLISYLCF